MQYENRTPEEGINTPNRHPLREFLRLGVIALLALLALFLLLNVAGSRLGGLIPFSAEVWVADRVDHALQEAGESSPFEIDNPSSPLTEYLQELGGRVETALGVEAPVEIKMHYSNADVVNALATLAGHVYFYKGLLKLLPNENALVMLMAHEYAHVNLRHPVRVLGSGLAAALGVAVLPGGGGIEGRLYSLAGSLGAANFSRDMESQADAAALGAVQAIYGHVAGADDLFALFMEQRTDKGTGMFEEFFSTHPLDVERMLSIAQLAESNGWSRSGSITPLPPQFYDWLGRED